ncbi:MAG: DNA replication/repair protein RecF [Bacteroidetes bacterium]|nr:DNA replication/repair protein RecF [Bacteroidota bacterium]
MYLSTISIVNFRNYEEVAADFSERINCFTGLNGSGKTNLLDVIHYLSLCKSFLNPVDSQNIRFDQPMFVVQGKFNSSGQEDSILCSVRKGQRKIFKKNGVDYDRLSDHIGSFPLVVVSPLDSVLITGGSEERRRFMDTVISQFNRNYLEHLIAYNRVLSQRNALLKKMSEGEQQDDGTLEILDLQLDHNGTPIYNSRKAFIRELLPFFSSNYSKLSGDAEQVELIYESKMHETSIADLLKKNISRDVVLGYTTSGIHKDDLDFIIAGHSLKRSGSQGQQKTFLIALKLAEYVFLDRASGKKPMLLLDDVHDKLDEERVTRLMETVCGNSFGQLFVTDTGAGRMDELFKAKKLPYKMFRVEEGRIVSQ